MSSQRYLNPFRYNLQRNSCPECGTKLRNFMCPQCGWPEIPKLIKKFRNREAFEGWIEWLKKKTKEDQKKRKAQDTVNMAIKSGEIQRPKLCELCGSSGRITGHHWSYKREHSLDVIWLCARCHGSFPWVNRKNLELFRAKIKSLKDEGKEVNFANFIDLALTQISAKRGGQVLNGVTHELGRSCRNCLKF